MLVAVADRPEYSIRGSADRAAPVVYLIEDSSLKTSRFFAPLNPEWFETWRRRILGQRGLLIRSDPTVYDTYAIHRVVAPVVFPSGSLSTIMDLFHGQTPLASRSVPSDIAPFARAVIRAIYTVRIYRDLFGPLPKYEPHPIYRVLAEDSEDDLQPRRAIARVLSFQIIIPRVTPVWESWKYLASQYGVRSVVELSRMVAFVASDARMFWFEEMFS
jgi:hypothetical protein